MFLKVKDYEKILDIGNDHHVCAGARGGAKAHA